MSTKVEGDQKAPFSIATTPRCMGEALLLPQNSSTLPLIRTLYYRVLSNEVSSTIFKVFGMTWPGIEPRSPGSLANILPTRPMSQLNNITELNELIYAGAKLVCEKIEIPSKSTKKQSKPGWEIRLKMQIKNLQKQVRMIRTPEWNKEEEGTGNMGENNCTTWGKKQNVMAKEGRLKRYRQRVKQYRQNRTFQNNERKFYQQLGGSDTKTYQQPDIKETERFWTKIWQPKKHNENSEWINNITREIEGLEKGPKIEIHVDLLRSILKRISNWKVPGHDGIHGFWFKKFTSIPDWLALEMNKCLQGAQVPEWMTKGKTTLIQKDPCKRTAPNNYRPITYLPMMWKILTA